MLYLLCVMAFPLVFIGSDILTGVLADYDEHHL